MCRDKGMNKPVSAIFWFTSNPVAKLDDRKSYCARAAAMWPTIKPSVPMRSKVD